MDSIQVTTVAGSGAFDSKDGIGLSAAFRSPEGMCYSPVDDSLLITETGSHCIRRLFPANPKRKAELHRLLHSVVPIQPLILIILDFSIATSKCSVAACAVTFVDAGISSADAVTTICGSRVAGFAHGNCLDARFNRPSAICVDPLSPIHCFYVGDLSSIRHVNTAIDTVSLIAGSDQPGWMDGVGMWVGFSTVYDLVCTSTSSSGNRFLYVSDTFNDCIRSVDVTNRTVTTVLGDRKRRSRNGLGLDCSIARPRKIVFDRSESVLYIASEGGICRFELGNKQLTHYQCRNDELATALYPSGLALTPRGQLLVSCMNLHSIFLLDPDTGAFDLLAGPGLAGAGQSGKTDGAGSDARFNLPTSLVVVEHERSAFMVESQGTRVRCITLPESLFH